MKICGNCGFNCADDADFCPNCDTYLEGNSESYSESPSTDIKPVNGNKHNTHKSKKLLITAVCAVLLVLIGVLAAVILGKSESGSFAGLNNTGSNVGEQQPQKVNYDKDKLFNEYKNIIRNTENVECYCVYDIDGNGIPELVTKTGTCESDYKYDFYTFEKKSVLLPGSESGGHTVLAAPLSGDGIMILYGHQNSYSILKVTISENAIKSEIMLEGVLTPADKTDTYDSYFKCYSSDIDYPTHYGNGLKLDYLYSEIYQTEAPYDVNDDMPTTEIESTTVKAAVQLPDVNLPSDVSQFVYVDTAAKKLSLYTRNNGAWEKQLDGIQCTVGRNGTTNSKREGDGKTPLGSYKIAFYFGLSNLNIPLTFKQVDTHSVWVDDVNSNYYNTLQSDYSVSWNSAEELYTSYFKDNMFNYLIYFNSNGDGLTAGSATPGNGSLITICGKNLTLEPTSGCIDISGNDMKVLLSYLNSSFNPYIVIK